MGAIRIVLAISVVLWHVPGHAMSLVDAGVAVLLFFVISGFYMALVINEKYQAGGIGWRRRFYASRLFRLFPAYLVMVAVSAATLILSPKHHFTLAATGQPLPASLTIVVMNLVILGQDVFQLFVNSLRDHEANALTAAVAAMMPAGYFDNHFMIVGQAWSLASELLFYALAPFVVRSPLRIIGLLAASLALRWGLIFGAGFSSAVWGYNFFPGTLCLFLLGSLSYHLHARLKAREAAKRAGMAVLAFYSAFALWSIWRQGGVLLTDPKIGYDTPSLWLAYAGFALSLPFLFAGSKANPVDRWIGELSYPLYLVHGMVLGVIFGYFHRPGSDALWLAAALLLSLAAAALLFMLVDRPVDAWRHRRYSPKRGFQPPANAAAIAFSPEELAGMERVKGIEPSS